MRRRCWCLVQMGPLNWVVVDLSGEERVFSTNVEQPWPSSEKAWELFQELGYDGGDVLLGLSATACLVGAIPALRLPSRCDDRTKLFLLEESLPVSAEEVTADFVDGGTETLGVAVVTEPLRQVIEQLESFGLNIQSIAPWSLLAASEWRDHYPNGDVCVARTALGMELIEIAEGQPHGWAIVATDAELLWRLEAIRVDLGRSPVVISELSRPADHPHEWIVADCSFDQAARLRARRILLGSVTPVVELRRDRLAGTSIPRALSGYLRAFQFTTGLLLMTMLAGVLWHGIRYQQLADDLVSRQREVFLQVLPGQPVPPGIRSRLESELTRLRSQQDAATKVPGRESALLTLVRFLEAVPTSIRLKVNGLSATGRQLSVRSEVRSAGDGSSFVQSLRESGFNARNPRSVRNGESYNVDFDAQLQPPTPGREVTP